MMNVIVEKTKIDKKCAKKLYYFFGNNLPNSLLSNIGHSLFFEFCKYLEKRSETKYYLLFKRNIISCLIFTRNGYEVINFLRRNIFKISIKLLFNMNLFNKYLLINSFFASLYNLNEKFFKNEIIIIATDKNFRNRGSASLLVKKVFRKYKILNVKSEIDSKKFYKRNNFKLVWEKKLGFKKYFFFKKYV